MKENNKSILILVTLIFILISFLVNVELIINNIINYTNIFFNKLFPVSFITYLIVYMLIEYGLVQFINKYLKITSCNIFLFILSFISGFPSGAKYTKLLYDKNIINKEQKIDNYILVNTEGDISGKITKDMKEIKNG